MAPVMGCRVRLIRRRSWVNVAIMWCRGGRWAAAAALALLPLSACGADDEAAPPTQRSVPVPSRLAVPAQARAEVLQVIGEVRPGLLKALGQDEAVRRSVDACRASGAAGVRDAFAGHGLPTLNDKQALTILTGLRKHVCDGGR